MRSGQLLRKCACGGGAGPDGKCEKCRRKELQRKTPGSGTNPYSSPLGSRHPGVPPIVHDVLNLSGRPLDPAARAFMEPRFRHDFSHVRVHTDAQAAKSAQAVNALAYAVGPHMVFGAGQYAPDTSPGRKLIAHELAHVLQQPRHDHANSGLEVASPESSQEREASALSDRVLAGTPAGVSQFAAISVQRDLATPEPGEPQPVKAALTDAQIREAIRYNGQFYDAANTRLIQKILGGPVTGLWTAGNISAIADTQEKYGLKKDGKVGPDTFQFIMNEQKLEGAGTETENCLTSFRPVFHPVRVNSTPGPNGTTRIAGHHVVEARFSSRCKCSEFQYRQFIAGAASVSRGSESLDLKGDFSHIPGGELPVEMKEDGNTTCPAQNYGHREQPTQESTTAKCGENRYADEKGVTDRDNGCVFRCEDFPTIERTGLGTGAVVDLLVQFRGEIRRNGKTIQTKNWTDINESATTP